MAEAERLTGTEEELHELPADPALLVPARPPLPGAVEAAEAEAVTTPPEGYAVPLGPPPAPPARPRGLLLGIAGVLLLAAGGIGFGLGRASVEWSAPDTFTVDGSMTVAGQCGFGGYSDIRDGTQVEIVNQDNKVLGVSALKSEDTSCHFTFSVRDVPTGERLYGASVGNSNRGTIWKTQEEAAAEGFHLTLG